MNAYDLALRKQIVSACLGGLTYEEVGDRFGVSVSAVRTYLRLHREGDLSPRPHGGGRRPSLSDMDRETLRHLREVHPILSGEELNQLFFQTTGVAISLTTVYRELRKMGFKNVPVPRKKALENKVSTERMKVRPHRVRQRRPVPGPGRDQAYPSDLTDAEWEILEPLVPAAKPGGRPEEWPKREIVNAILYVLRSGCPWRMLPHDFPPYTTVYDYCRAWRDQGLWEKVNTTLSKRLRVMAGRNADPTGGIADSQSAKTTEKGGPAATTAASGYLAGSVTLSSTPKGW
ncbi:hypothetical protein D3C87_1318670 [compost metagenome]